MDVGQKNKCHLVMFKRACHQNPHKPWFSSTFVNSEVYYQSIIKKLLQALA